MWSSSYVLERFSVCLRYLYNHYLITTQRESFIIRRHSTSAFGTDSTVGQFQFRQRKFNSIEWNTNCMWDMNVRIKGCPCPPTAHGKDKRTDWEIATDTANKGIWMASGYIPQLAIRNISNPKNCAHPERSTWCPSILPRISPATTFATIQLASVRPTHIINTNISQITKWMAATN